MTKFARRLTLGLLLAVLAVTAATFVPENPSSMEGEQLASAGRYHTYKRRNSLYDRSRPSRPSRGLYTVGG